MSIYFPNHKMTVTFVINDNRRVDIPNGLTIVLSSEYIKNLLSDTEVSDVVDIVIPHKYTHVIDIYINFLLRHMTNDNKDVNKINTVSKQQIFNSDKWTVDMLCVCFDMESYFADDIFFDYLICKAYSMWDEFYPMIDKLPNQRLIYLHTPYQYVPDNIMTKQTFFDEWIQTNQHTNIVIRHKCNNKCNPTYTLQCSSFGKHVTHYIDVKYYGERDDDEEGRGDEGGVEEDEDDEGGKQIKQLNVYQHVVTFNVKDEAIYQYCQFWYRIKEEQGQQHEGHNRRGLIQYQNYFVNGQHHGVQFAYHENGQLAYKINYSNGKEHGIQELWYENDTGQGCQLTYRHNYVDGQLHGLQETWYENGQIESRNHHTNGVQHGVQLSWYNNGKLLYKNHYENGVWHGIQESWYDNGQLEHRLNCDHGKQDGLQQRWSNNGKSEYIKLYKTGVFVCNMPNE